MAVVSKYLAAVLQLPVVTPSTMGGLLENNYK
jgi:hypothetical protein